MRNADEEMNQAGLELQQIGEEALDRCLAAGAQPDDLKTIAWLAGLTKWTPNADRKTAGVG